jgi:hypothetical protein
MSLEQLFRQYVKEEIALAKAEEQKEAVSTPEVIWSPKTRLFALAQEIINTVRPGETVQEVLINTNSAEPIEEVIEQAKEIVENAKKQPKKKTVFTLMFMLSNSPAVAFPSTTWSPNRFETLEEAMVALKKANQKFPLYFLLQHEA